MKSGKGFEMPGTEAPVFHVCRRQNPVGERLSCYACHDRPPVIQGELGKGHNRDRQYQCGEHPFASPTIVPGSPWRTNSPEVPAR